MTTVEFDVELFEQRLTNLKDTQDGIQQMSSWCLQQRAHHKKIVSSWLNVLKQVRVEHRLTLFYLANDVIQYSKRKNYEFVESWGTTLQKATTMVRDEKVRNKIFRIFKIWEQREIYSEEYLADLNGLLSLNPVKKQQPQSNAEPSDEYQNTALISNIRDCVRLGSCTDKNFKKLPKAPICDTETIKNTLKDRTHSEDVEREIDEFVASLETYIKSLKSEIKCRKSLINNIEQASTFYTNQRGEVKVVVNAYKNFGNRIKVVKKKLEELTPNLPSPIPSPDINAPSPEQDADIVLPDENNLTTSMFKSQTNGYTSYMDGNLPFDINDFKRESPRSAYETPSHTATQPIQVISSRSEEKSSSFDHTDYYKPVMDSNTYVRSNIPLPVPPVSNYPLSQSNAASYNSEPVSYGPDAYDPMTATYTSDSNYIANSGNNNYDNNMPNMSNMPLMPPPPMPPLLDAQNDEFNSTWDMDMTWTPMDTSSSFNHSINTPVSPPHFDRREGVNSNHVQYVENVNEELIPLQDVDHRQLHIPPAISIKTSLGKEKGRFGDVDHRNLISLTGSPGAPKSLDNRRSSENNRRHFSSKLSDKDFRNFVPSTPLLRTDNKIRTQSPDQDYRKPGDTDYRHQNLLEVPKEITPIPALTMITPVTTTITPVTTIVLSPQTTPPPDSSSPNSLETPPLVPPLEPPAFPKIGDFLTPPPNMVDTSMPPPNFSKDDIDNESKCNEGSSPIEITEITALTPNDIVETIDMELSDDDFEDFMAFDTEEISNQSIPEIGEDDVQNDDVQNDDIQNDDVQNDDVQNDDEQIDEEQNDDEIPSPNYDSDPQPLTNSPPEQQPNFKVPLLRTPSPEFSENFHQLHQQHQQQHHHHQQQQQQQQLQQQHQQQQHQQHQQQQHQQQHRQPQSWDNFKQLIRPNTNNNNNNGNNMPNTWNPPVNTNLQNAWKPPRMPMPGMLNQVVPGSGMPPPVMPMPQGVHGMQGNQSFPRGPLFSPQRNFSPQMRPNFRGSPMRPRGGSPYFNNRGRGGMRGGPPQMGSRGNFRGKSWQ